MIQNVQVDDALLHLEALLVSIVQKEALMLVPGKNDAWVEFPDHFITLLSDRKKIRRWKFEKSNLFILVLSHSCGRRASGSVRGKCESSIFTVC